MENITSDNLVDVPILGQKRNYMTAVNNKRIYASTIGGAVRR